MDGYQILKEVMDSELRQLRRSTLYVYGSARPVLEGIVERMSVAIRVAEQLEEDLDAELDGRIKQIISGRWIWVDDLEEFITTNSRVGYPTQSRQNPGKEKPPEGGEGTN